MSAVVVSLNVEGFGQSDTEMIEIERTVWDSLTQPERLRLLEDMASDYAANYVGWGWHIDDPDDYAAATEVRDD